MSGTLTTLAELQAYLGDTDSADDALLQALLDQVTAMLAAECGRQATPWGDAQAGRVEVCDGTGTDVLWLPYPIATVTTVAIGVSATSPDETLAGTGDALSWDAGDRRLVRIDGGRFSGYAARRRVRVTYDTAADRPADAVLAVHRVTAAIYQQRGAEDATSERTGSYQADLARVADSDPVWAQALAHHSRRVF